jgi:hypothetical protein
MSNDIDNNGTVATPPATVSSSGAKQSHVHFKMLPCWPENPGLWFTQVECVPANRNISREFTKCCLVEKALPPNSFHLVTSLFE